MHTDSEFTTSLRALSERRGQETRINPSDLHRPLVMQLSLKPVISNQTHAMIHACVYASLSAPAHCDCFSERNDVERPHTRINAQCNRWCILLSFLFSARAHAHPCAHTNTHMKNTRILHVLPFSWVACWIKWSTGFIPQV